MSACKLQDALELAIYHYTAF